jgi:phospholipid/cholesterol/gamma-HCH transport system substrate-binding protein
MDDRGIQFRVGVLVVATVMLLGFLAVLFGRYPRQLLTGTKTIYVRFPSAPGVTKETPVRKSGILIGRVQDVQLTEQDGVLVTVGLDPNYIVRQNELIRIRAGTIFGDAMLEFVPGGDPASSREEITDGMYLDGVVTGDLLEVLQSLSTLETDVRQALGSIQSAGNEVATTARSLNDLVEGNRQQFGEVLTSGQEVLNRTNQALERIDRAMESVADLLTDEEMNLQLREALLQIPNIVADASSLMVILNQVGRAAERNLVNLQGFTQPLGEQGEALVTAVRGTAEKLDGLIDELTLFSRSLNSSEGTIAQLVHNPDLYQELQLSAQNIQEVTARLKPLVDDLRVFADKIARNPGRIASGVLQPRETGIK